MPPSGVWRPHKIHCRRVETDPADVLRDEFNRRDRVGIIALQCDVETLILGAGAVIGEVQRFLDQSVEIDAPAFATAATRMLQHARDDIVGAPTVFGDLFEIAAKHVDCFVDLGPPLVV